MEVALAKSLADVRGHQPGAQPFTLDHGHRHDGHDDLDVERWPRHAGRYRAFDHQFFHHGRLFARHRPTYLESATLGQRHGGRDFLLGS